MFTITYWPDWAGGEPRQFSRESFEGARSRLDYWLSFDPDMAIVVRKDGVRLLVSAFLEGREEPR